jgi:hypothetical protein
VIDRFSLVTRPRVTSGAPPVPPAFPTAVTSWPTLTVEERPSVTVFRCDAPLSLSSAMSAARCSYR